MAKTLADMTTDEREACVGMWASHQGHEDKNEPCGNLGVISEIDREYAWVAFPKEHAETYVFDFADLTPRFDLPRAWTPDGEPVPGEWEDGHVFVSYDDPDPWIVKDTVSIEGLSEGGMSYYQEPPNGIAVKLDRFGEGEGKARRWVGEWQKTNE